MAPKRGLGKGLDALIPQQEVPVNPNENKNNKESIKSDENRIEKYVDIDLVMPNRDQPRKTFNDETIQELAENIKTHGVITPILVVDRGTFYMIVTGERRWRASRLAGLKEIPVVIRDLTEQQILEFSIIENLQRENLNPIEEAQAYKSMMDRLDMTQEEVAERVNKSRAAIANSVRLLKLDEQVQQMVADGDITEGHARAIIPVENSNEQYKLALKIYNEGMTVRDIEKYIRDLNKPEKNKAEKKQNESLLAIYEKKAEELKQSMGTKVSIISKNDKGAGKIEIEFYSHDDFERIVELLKNN